MTRPRIPALHLLSALEAAARRRSFKDAADELAVTPSAVSQRIRRLETQLGFDLFDRLNRGISLTPDGTAYLREIRSALAMIADVTERFATAQHPVIVVAMNSIVAHEMVIPQLARFRKFLPGTEISVRTRPSMKIFNGEGEREGIHAGIRIGIGPWAGFHHRLIEPLSMVPLCSPKIAGRVRDWDDFQKQTLFCARGRRQETLEAVRSPVSGRYHDRVETFETLVEAVRAVDAGLGVLCGMLPLMSNLVRQGRLVVPLASAPLTSAEALHFLVPEGDGGSKRLSRTCDWIVDCYERLPVLPAAAGREPVAVG